MKDTEIGIPEWQVSEATNTMFEHDAMSGTVHGLETLASLVRLEDEHVLLVILVVTRGLPKLQVEDVRGDDFLVATHAVLLSDHLDQLVVDEGTLGEEEGAAWRHFKVIEETLRTANDTMVTLLGLLNEVHVFFQLLLRGEGDSIDSLQTVIGGLSEPVSGRVAHHLKTFNELGGGNMRARAQVNEVTTFVGSNFHSIANLASNGRDLEGVRLEEGQGLLLGQHKSLELLIGAGNLLCGLFDRGVIFLRENLRAVPLTTKLLLTS